MARCRELAFIKRAIERDGKREDGEGVCMCVWVSSIPRTRTHAGTHFFGSTCSHTSSFPALIKHFIFPLGKTTIIALRPHQPLRHSH